MIPVVTPTEMGAIDDAAPEPVEKLIERAGAAVAREALDLLGGAYGRRVVVVAGTGNNGADGRDAARRLRRRGVSVREFSVDEVPASLPPCDLVIDAAFGTGFHGEWAAPDPGEAPVLAVDVPSGVDALTGAAGEGVMRATRTVTFQAYKPGLLSGPGRELAGDVRVADIGLDVSSATCHLVEGADVARWWPRRPSDAHKWRSAVKVVAGSAGMPGAAVLCSTAAARAGGTLVSLSSPGATPDTRPEIVQTHVDAHDFADEALVDLDRFSALVVGPGLGRDDAVLRSTRTCISDAAVATVIDGDALFACSRHPDGPAAALGGRTDPTVLTPHDGEFEYLTGSGPGADRVASARAAAAEFGCVVLLKGPTTVVACPPGDGDPTSSAPVLLVADGDQRLATAGTGDVLAGIVGAALAVGIAAPEAAAAAAWIHAAASRRLPPDGLLAGDLLDELPAVIGGLR